MRQGQQNRRGRGRTNNGHSQSSNHNQSSSSNNNRKGQNPLTRSFESTGPDVKIRGNPAHIAEKYMQLARDAQTSGDPVLAENYLQHAEHYNRIILTYREQQLAEAAGQAPNPATQAGVMPRSRFQSDDDMSDDGDDQQTDAGGQIRGQEPQPGLYDASGAALPRPDRDPRQDRGGSQDRSSQERGGQDRGGADRGGQDRGNRDREFTPRDGRDGNRDRPMRDDRGAREDRPYRNDRPQQDRPQRTFDDRPQRRPVEGQQGAEQQGRAPDRAQERPGRERFEQNRGYNSDRNQERGGQDRADRPQRFDRPERVDRDRTDRGDRPAGDRPERIDRGNRFERPDRPERSDRYDRHATEANAGQMQAGPQDIAPRVETVVERPVEAFVPRADVKPEIVHVDTQPTLDLESTVDAVPTPRAAPRRRAPAAASAARFAEAAGGDAPEFLTRPVRRPRRADPVADAEAPAAPVNKTEPE
jgi:hypothetical protein